MTKEQRAIERLSYWLRNVVTWLLDQKGIEANEEELEIFTEMIGECTAIEKAIKEE